MVKLIDLVASSVQTSSMKIFVLVIVIVLVFAAIFVGYMVKKNIDKEKQTRLRVTE